MTLFSNSLARRATVWLRTASTAVPIPHGATMDSLTVSRQLGIDHPAGGPYEVVGFLERSVLLYDRADRRSAREMPLSPAVGDTLQFGAVELLVEVDVAAEVETYPRPGWWQTLDTTMLAATVVATTFSLATIAVTALLPQPQVRPYYLAETEAPPVRLLPQPEELDEPDLPEKLREALEEQAEIQKEIERQAEVQVEEPPTEDDAIAEDSPTPAHEETDTTHTNEAGRTSEPRGGETSVAAAPLDLVGGGVMGSLQSSRAGLSVGIASEPQATASVHTGVGGSNLRRVRSGNGAAAVGGRTDGSGAGTGAGGGRSTEEATYSMTALINRDDNVARWVKQEVLDALRRHPAARKLSFALDSKVVRVTLRGAPGSLDYELHSDAQFSEKEWKRMPTAAATARPDTGGV